MRLSLLDLDDALGSQTDFIRACKNAEVDLISAAKKAGALDLWGKQQRLDDCCRALENQWTGGRAGSSTFMGSGNIQHITTFLMAFALEGLSARITINHFNNHSDRVNVENGKHCGSWISHAANPTRLRW